MQIVLFGAPRYSYRMARGWARHTGPGITP
jgi:hypothetical protein